MADDNAAAEEGVHLRIVRVQASASPTYSNNLVVQKDGPDFHFRFYQIIPPVIAGESHEERARDVEALGGIVEATCVSHIVVPAERALEFAALINKVVKKPVVEAQN
jgi:hypothetical protein